jgi:demethylmenaquinone methyltransferase/2-methoxy-6-polyprenyl-1,4-benzoquinol methylase
MTESYYVAGADRSQKVRELFNAIASRYDLINDLQSFGLHRFWKKQLIRMAKVSPGDLALDLCTGTGDIALKLASSGARVVGCDFSESMLEEARRRSKMDIEWVQGDALKLSFADNTFNIVTMGYGLRNLANFHQGLSEILRVLKPGGRLLILEFGKPENRFWRFLYFSYLRIFVPLLGALVSRNRAAYAYILESLSVYPGQMAIHRDLLEMNCRKVTVKNFFGGVMSINYAEKG